MAFFSLIFVLIFANNNHQVCNARPQVNQEIDNLEDLLAVESSQFDNFVDTDSEFIDAHPNFVENDINPSLTPILPPPPGFGGDRLTAAPVTNSNGDRVINPDGSYSFRYSSSDGTERQEFGSLNTNGGHSSVGKFSYIGPDGRNYEVTFEAGVNGYQPQGTHLPQPPALPPALQRWEDAKNGKLRRQRQQSNPRIQFKRELIDEGGQIKFRSH